MHELYKQGDLKYLNVRACPKCGELNSKNEITCHKCQGELIFITKKIETKDPDPTSTEFSSKNIVQTEIDEKDENYNEEVNTMATVSMPKKEVVEQTQTATPIGVIKKTNPAPVAHNSDARVCPNCGNECTDSDVFCGKCGFKIGLEDCVNCGKKFKSSLLYCPYCGHKKGLVTVKQVSPSPNTNEVKKHNIRNKMALKRGKKVTFALISLILLLGACTVFLLLPILDYSINGFKMNDVYKGGLELIGVKIKFPFSSNINLLAAVIQKNDNFLNVYNGFILSNLPTKFLQSEAIVTAVNNFGHYFMGGLAVLTLMAYLTGIISYFCALFNKRKPLGTKSITFSAVMTFIFSFFLAAFLIITKFVNKQDIKDITCWPALIFVVLVIYKIVVRIAFKKERKAYLIGDLLPSNNSNKE